MRKVLTVAWRDFLTTVRTKGFILSVVLLPAIVVAGIYGTQFAQKLAETEEVPDRAIAIVDRSGRVYDALAAQMDVWNAERANQRFLPKREAAVDESAEAALREQVAKGEIYAALILPADVLASGEPVAVIRRDKQLDPGMKLQRFLNQAVSAVRFVDARLDPQQIAELSRHVATVDIDPTSGDKRESNMMARLMTPFAFMFLLFMGTFGISQGLLTSLIEEKSSRVIEVLLSAISPMQLMAGKILGTSLVGLMLLVVWGAVGFYSARHYNMAELVTPYHVVMAVLYFIPGFLLMAAILAAIGSTCNELRDAQAMVFPLSVLTIIPMMFWFFIAQNPQASFSIALSYVPPITPLIMILRVCTDPDTPMLQIVSTLVLLWTSVFAMFWVSAKIFRIGVLMYGKPPTVGEMVRWVRYA